MTSADIPADLIQLQRDLDAANHHCEQLAEQLPSAIDVATGKAQFSDEELEELRDARARRDKIAMDLIGHPWWATQANRFEARRRLREAARAEQ